MTPTQLYDRLLRGSAKSQPSDVSEGLKSYRYGKGNMQIHYALKSPPRWKAGADAFAKVALLHLTPGLDGVSRACQRMRAWAAPRCPHHLRRPADGLRTRAARRMAKPFSGCSFPKRRATSRAMPLPTFRYRTGRTSGPRNSGSNMRIASSAFSKAISTAGRRMSSPARPIRQQILRSMNMNLVGGDPYGGYLRPSTSSSSGARSSPR